MIINIKINDINDIKKLHNLATVCNFDVFVKCNESLIDAKSILGLAAFTGRDNLQLVFPNHINKQAIKSAMKKVETMG